jgi:hypothetical protein
LISEFFKYENRTPRILTYQIDSRINLQYLYIIRTTLLKIIRWTLEWYQEWQFNDTVILTLDRRNALHFWMGCIKDPPLHPPSEKLGLIQKLGESRKIVRDCRSSEKRRKHIHTYKCTWECVCGTCGVFEENLRVHVRCTCTYFCIQDVSK